MADGRVAGGPRGRRSHALKISWERRRALGEDFRDNDREDDRHDGGLDPTDGLDENEPCQRIAVEAKGNNDRAPYVTD